MAECCQLVGNLQLGGTGCIISVTTNCSSEISKPCGGSDVFFLGATQTTSITAYASNSIHRGCPGRAGVSISWIKKYDCMNNKTYFIFAGEGDAYISGEVSVASIHKVGPALCDGISASSSSGPTSIYMVTSQSTGYGLTYTGGPYSFSSNAIEGTILDFGFGTGFLQNFSYECQPGQIPTASYTIVTALDTT